jgi:hypothetical protein
LERSERRGKGRGRAARARTPRSPHARTGAIRMGGIGTRTSPHSFGIGAVTRLRRATTTSDDADGAFAEAEMLDARARVTRRGRRRHDALGVPRLKASPSLRRGRPQSRAPRRRIDPDPTLWQADARGKPPSNRHAAQRQPNGNAGTRSFPRPMRIRAARRGLRRNLRKPDMSSGCPSSCIPLIPQTAQLFVERIG